MTGGDRVDARRPWKEPREATRDQAACITFPVTLTPTRELAGLPAGAPFQSHAATILDFDGDGKLVRETIYGSFGHVLACVRRMRGTSPSRRPRASR